MSAPYPDWLTAAIASVKALCPADVEPKLTDDEIANACIQNPFPLLGDEPDDADPRIDIYAAVGDCWVLKAGKVAGDYWFDEAGMRDHPDQVFDHAIMMADRYNPIGIA